MGISGSLKDVSVADVMQFIHLGRRTGTLLLNRGVQRAMIGFHRGRLVSAQAPQTPKLGDLLVSSGMIDRGILARAIQSQRDALEHRSLGQILISSGSIDPEGLRQVIAQQIEQAVSEVMVWDNGTFEFAIDDLRPIDDIALYPSDVLPDADINTQMVLLEAARIFDERNRDRAEGRSGEVDGDATNPTMVLNAASSRSAMALPGAPEDEAGDGPKHAAELLKLHVVSSDQELVQKLAEALQHEIAAVEIRGLGQAGLPELGEPHPIVLVDLRQGQVSVEETAALHRSRPRASVIALVDPGASFVKAYEAGVLA